MNTDREVIRVRIAPSPTGAMHLGLARTALYNWLFARRRGGRFVLRIDDTDRQRNLADVLQPILDGLRWLGIEWDEGPEVGGPHEPYFQSGRVAHHQQAVERLIELGAAYLDYATSEELAAERASAIAEKRSTRNSRRWAGVSPEVCSRFESEGRQAVVRLNMPTAGRLVINDLVRGQVEFDWVQEQDHVVRRANGSVLYHLASVVDDHDYEITHVIRAEEHLSNTPRQVFIARALGYPLPEYAHLPFVAEPGSRNKLSKRKLSQYMKNRDFAGLVTRGRHIAERIGLSTDEMSFSPVTVEFYRAVGFLPEALVNYLALLGWSLDDRSESFSRDELVRVFSLDRVNRAPASFDPAKLMAFQVRQMLALPVTERVRLTMPFLQRAGLVGCPVEPETEGRLTAVITAAGDRLKIAGDVLEFDDFFTRDERLNYDQTAFAKRLLVPGAVELLARFRARLAECDRFSAPVLEELLNQFMVEEDIKVGRIIHALRVALTGKAVGFGMFETMAILGRSSCLARIDRALVLAKDGFDPGTRDMEMQ